VVVEPPLPVVPEDVELDDELPAEQAASRESDETRPAIEVR